MIEIPEAHTLSSQLVETVGDKTITSVTAGFTPHKFVWYFGDTAGYQSVAQGKSLGTARAVGGMVEWSGDGVSALFSEGIQVRYVPPGDPHPKKHQLMIEFADGSAVSASASMYGGVGVFPTGGCDNQYYLIAQEKPTPLSPDFDRAYFQALVSSEGAGRLSAKAFLATEQRVPGLGNGVLQDILYNAKIHPKTKMESLSGDRVDVMFGSIRTTLSEMTELGGRDTEADLHGKPGGYPTRLSRKTVGSDCTVCGSPIQKASYMGGSIYFCPGCQPL